MDGYEVLVVGGGAAGLTAAVALARFGRRVAVIDAGEPRNRTAEGVHNLLGREGVAPAELIASGRRELARYGGELVLGRATGAVRRAGRIEVRLEDGTRLTAPRVVVATGVRDDLPDVPGLRDRWGRDVVHCPFCHGWEVRGRRIGVLGTGAGSLHQAQLFRELSDHVVLLAGDEPVAGEDRRSLAARGIAVRSGAVRRVVVEADRVVAVELADGTAVPVEAVVVAPVPRAESAVLDDLGVPLESDGGYRHDAVGATGATGVWVAGNAAAPMAATAAAIASGSAAAGGVTADVVRERIAAALAA